MMSKSIQTMTPQQLQQLQQLQQQSSSVEEKSSSDSSASSKSLWRMFSEDWLPTSIVPTNILGVPVVDIQSDLREGTTQISEFFSGLFGTGLKEEPGKKTTTASSSKPSSNVDQTAPAMAVQQADRTIDEHRTSERTINDSDTHIHDHRIQSYGWSLPKNNESSIDLPLPIHCEAIFDSKDQSQLWCSTSLHHSSIIWMAAKYHDTAIITILDTKQPEIVLDRFDTENTVIYTMANVPKVSETDYPYEPTGTSCTLASFSTVKIDPLTPKNETRESTLWLGSGDGWLFIHSTNTGQHRSSVEKIWLRHAIYSIVHVRGRVFVALANEKILVFHRNASFGGTWNFNEFEVVLTGQSRECVRCLLNVADTSLWCGVANRVHVLDLFTLKTRKQFYVYPQAEHAVQHMTWSDQGVWLSVRFSSSLQLYHAETYEHLQDIDLRPSIENILSEFHQGLRPCFIHISALMMTDHRLWIGTGNGIIVSIPTSNVDSIPFCHVRNLQLSLHGFRDAVKFLLIISDENSSVSSIVTGGDGYVDYRVEKTDSLSSHLIIWQSKSH